MVQAWHFDETQAAYDKHAFADSSVTRNPARLSEPLDVHDPSRHRPKRCISAEFAYNPVNYGRKGHHHRFRPGGVDGGDLRGSGESFSASHRRGHQRGESPERDASAGATESHD